MASWLPEELRQEIFVRLPSDELVHLVHASLVCKAWHRVLSDRNCFLRRCRGFHGAPPLLGYIHDCYGGGSTIQIVPMTTTIASPVPMPSLGYHSYPWLTLDCRHGRMLLLAGSLTALMVWDPIIGTKEHIRVPFCNMSGHRFMRKCYAGVLLCAKDGCDHLDCHGGPFHVVIVETRGVGSASPCASKYSSLTNEWSAPTINRIISCPNMLDTYIYNMKQNPIIGDAIYFPIRDGSGMLKYDLSTHWLSWIGMPHTFSMAIPMETEDEGLGLVSLMDNCVHMWSWQDVTNEIGGGWVEHRVYGAWDFAPEVSTKQLI